MNRWDLISMTTAKPHIRCVDYWPVHIPDICLAAYKDMIESKQISNHHVIFNQQLGSSIVEYDSTIPHVWMIDELRQAAIAHIE